MKLNRRDFITACGAFAATNSLARPVRGILGLDEEFEDSPIVDPTAADYVQDGLIAIWDGIENVGWGEHDPDSTFWVELISGEAKQVISTYRRWSEEGDALEVSPEATSTQQLAQMKSASFIIDYVGHVESVSYRTKESELQVSPLWWTTADYHYGWGTNLDPALPIHEKVSISFQIASTGSGTVRFKSSPYVTCKGSASLAKNFRFFASFRSDPWSGICCVRMYSRPLSDIEIHHNYLIDKMRFGL